MERCVRNTLPPAPLRNHSGFLGCFGAETVIHGRRLHLPRIGCVSKREQRHAVGSARYGNTEPFDLRRTIHQPLRILPYSCTAGLFHCIVHRGAPSPRHTYTPTTTLP